MRSRGILRTALTAAVATLAASGCYSATFADARFQPDETHDVWLHGYVYGLVGSTAVDTRFSCRGEATGVGFHESAATFALTFVTLGIYTPRMATITCSGGAATARRP